MKGNALLRVTEALRGRLELALAASGVPGTVFVGPLDDADATGATLILFLYKVVPNSALRNREHRVASAGTQLVEVLHNSLPLDLFYLVTVGTKPGASEETPLQALGFVMQALQTAPDLTGAAVDHEQVRLTLEPLTTEESSRIWTLFPTANYRTSIAYLASPVWIDPAQPVAVGAPVVSDELRSGIKAEVVA